MLDLVENIATDRLNSDKLQKTNSKEEKRKKIKEILKQKLNISNIQDVVLGRRQSFDEEEFRLDIENMQEDFQGNNLEKIKFGDLYKFKGILGVGVFGVVVLVTKIENNEQRALKIIYKSRLDIEETNVIKTESEILWRLRDKLNVVQFYQVIKYQYQSFINRQMENIAGGQLKRIYDKRLFAAKKQDYFRQKFYELRSQDDEPLPDEAYESKIYLREPLFTDEEAAKIIKGVINGLVNVHEYDIIHRDIKPENILLMNQNEIETSDIKLVDFGLSAKFKANQRCQIDDRIGTLLYMAPEQISIQTYGKVNSNNNRAREMVLPTININRYDAKRALQHPWITRNSNDKIPLTRTEEMQQYNIHTLLSKVIKAATFLQICKQNNEPGQQNVNRKLNFFNDNSMELSDVQPNDSHFAFLSNAQDASYIKKLKNEIYKCSEENIDYHSFSLGSFLENQDNTAITEASKRNSDVPKTFLPQIQSKFSQREDSREFSIKKTNTKKEIFGVIQREREKISSYQNSGQKASNEAYFQSKMTSPSPALRKDATQKINYYMNSQSMKKKPSQILMIPGMKPNHEKLPEETLHSLGQKQSEEKLFNRYQISKNAYKSEFNLTSNQQDELVRNFPSESPQLGSSKGKFNLKRPRDQNSPIIENTVRLQQNNFTQAFEQKQILPNQNPTNLQIKLAKCNTQTKENPSSNSQLLMRTQTLNQNRYLEKAEKHSKYNHKQAISEIIEFQQAKQLSMPPIYNQPNQLQNSSNNTQMNSKFHLNQNNNHQYQQSALSKIKASRNNQHSVTDSNRQYEDEQPQQRKIPQAHSGKYSVCNSNELNQQLFTQLQQKQRRLTYIDANKIQLIQTPEMTKQTSFKRQKEQQ
ncbi:protein kinase domain containing protein [Stylonychia lemnae]|uniref:Protein kinase domain containing protein n=1 Tax=Stylonychia lemnae TaxID=5949 RepID=A0A078B8H9_STYLE|nr:protein kinase domain containing protein [Stylonychia lemnae]|eukprot:CDW90501.1 protein kinase domain containing protein [Stylonychia lemnae]